LAPHGFDDYLCEILGKRIAEGYSLEELQRALRIFEELLWRLCAQERRDRDQLVRDLAVVTTIIGAAKDHLARVYLERAQERIRQMQRKLDVFRGLPMVTATVD
jgi:hypothetical protein